MTLTNDLLLRAARGEKTERTPVWVMRQAGRILKEYIEVRKKLSGFIDLVKSPELAAEVTIQPVDILGVDAAIIFSDILVIPEAMGLPYQMLEGRGPFFPETINTEDELKKLRTADDDSLGYVVEAIKLTKKELNGRVPLIGFTGAPWTLFCYMIEGKGSKTFSLARRMLYEKPAFSHALLSKITDSIINYLKLQTAAGADILQVFDSWAGVLPPWQYDEFSLKYISKIIDGVGDIPTIIFAKGAYGSRKTIGNTNCNVVGLDWNMNIKESRTLIGENKTLQGNMDPAALYAGFDNIRAETRNMLNQFGPYRHIANLGHGVYPDTKADSVKCFIDEVKEYSTKMRQGDY